MKYLNIFDNKDALDSAMASFQHGNGAFVFGVKTDQGIENVTIYDLRHPGPNCPDVYEAYPVNMSPVKLDASSTKKIPAVADILYSTSDSKLTLDALTNNVDNTPIAICVITEVMENFSEGDLSTGAVKTARFVSINYMNYNTPAIGSKTPLDMYFGNSGTTIGNEKGETDNASYIGGKWNTQQCLTKAINQEAICDIVTNNSDTGYCAPVCCCVAYFTPGTKPGDWYLPMPDELYQIYANKKAIDEKRKTLVGNGFSEITEYWSSKLHKLKKLSNNEYLVDLGDGYINGCYKGYSNYVLAFLALEV